MRDGTSAGPDDGADDGTSDGGSDGTDGGASTATGEDTRPPATRTGPGRVLVAVYAVFVLAASARAGVQIGTRFDEAPVAYVLSACAAGIYVLATIGLAGRGRGFRRLALVACGIELVGVLAIGGYSLLNPAAFPDETVWSHFGRGYLFVPLVLPVVGLLWLRRTATRTGPAR